MRSRPPAVAGMFYSDELRNSGDTAGPRNRVVGYGAFAVS